jgi:large subunit ribosomal protein L6
MSRIGKTPILVPAGVTVLEKERSVSVKGPKGALELTLRPEVDIEVGEKEVLVQLSGTGAKREARAFHGLTRALLSNMVVGVSEGFNKTLDIIGVGWNAASKGKQLTLNIGFCHPVIFDIPEGLVVETPKATRITISGADKQLVGQFTATVRAVRPPEPYKGKGIRYEGEYVRRKTGKTFGS